MRGGVTISELLDMNPNDFKFFADLIEENLEISRKTKQLII